MKKIETAYSIWILPQDDMYLGLSTLIVNAAHIGDGVIFEPHLTIIGDIEGDRRDLTMKTKALSSTLQPIRIELQELVVIEECALISVSLTSEIKSARQQAVEIFDQKKEEVYRPHISLFYGSVSESLSRFLAIQFTALPKTSVAQYLYLTETPVRSQPNEWRILNKFAFGYP